MADNVDEVIEKVKKFVRKLRKSGKDRDLFQELQRLLELPVHYLKKGINIRWNSLHNMLVRFWENRRVIEQFLLSTTKDYLAFTSNFSIIF
jgi:secreted Zn-dependent insulinase-like peptidase